MKATEQVKYYCQECGKELIGRKDKKFCNISCKNKYNNRRNQTIRKYREDTINRLSRNYEILESLLMEKQPYIGLEELSDLGFDYDCFTSRQKSRTGHETGVVSISAMTSALERYSISKERTLPNFDKTDLLSPASIRDDRNTLAIKVIYINEIIYESV